MLNYLSLNDYCVYEANLTTLDSVLFEDIETLPKEEQVLWKKVINAEIESLNKNEVDLPKNEKTMSCKYMLHIKQNNVYKAKLLALGFEQKPSIIYFETYSPVISISLLCLVVTIMTQRNLEIYTLHF